MPLSSLYVTGRVFCWTQWFEQGKSEVLSFQTELRGTKQHCFVIKITNVLHVSSDPHGSGGSTCVTPMLYYLRKKASI